MHAAAAAAAGWPTSVAVAMSNVTVLVRISRAWLCSMALMLLGNACLHTAHCDLLRDRQVVSGQGRAHIFLASSLHILLHAYCCCMHAWMRVAHRCAAPDLTAAIRGVQWPISCATYGESVLVVAE
jgi:hypothetical protein